MNRLRKLIMSKEIYENLTFEEMENNIVVIYNDKVLDYKKDYEMSFVSKLILIFKSDMETGDNIEVECRKNKRKVSFDIREGIVLETFFKWQQIESKEEPANNDGRKNCFWCGSPTKIVQGFVNTYDMCDVCKK